MVPSILSFFSFFFLFSFLLFPWGWGQRPTSPPNDAPAVCPKLHMRVLRQQSCYLFHAFLLFYPSFYSFFLIIFFSNYLISWCCLYCVYSPSASSDLLSDKRKYPYFMRMSPPQPLPGQGHVPPDPPLQLDVCGCRVFERGLRRVGGGRVEGSRRPRFRLHRCGSGDIPACIGRWRQHGIVNQFCFIYQENLSNN